MLQTAYTIPIALGLSLVASMAGPASGDEPPTGTSTPSPALRAATNAATFSLDFPGGQAKQFVAEIRKALGGSPLNVQFVDGAEDLMVKPLRLENVSALTGLRAMQHQDSTTFAEVEIEWDGRIGAGEPLFVVRPHVRDRSKLAATLTPSAPLVLSLKDAIVEGEGGIGLETVLSAIEAALSEVEGPKPKLKLHRESGLLVIVGGQNRHRDLALEIVRIMENHAKSMHSAAMAREQNIAVATERDLVRRYELENAKLQQMIEMLERDNRRLRDVGESYRAEAARAEDTARDLQNAIKQLEAQLKK